MLIEVGHAHTVIVRWVLGLSLCRRLGLVCRKDLQCEPLIKCCAAIGQDCLLMLTAADGCPTTLSSEANLDGREPLNPILLTDRGIALVITVHRGYCGYAL